VSPSTSVALSVIGSAVSSSVATSWSAADGGSLTELTVTLTVALLDVAQAWLATGPSFAVNVKLSGPL
jgi:hypothetical protein